MRRSHTSLLVVLLLTTLAGAVMAQQAPPTGGQPTNTSSSSGTGTQTVVATRSVLRDCFQQGVPGEGCLLRVATEAHLLPGVQANVLAPTPDGAPIVVLGQVTLGPRMGASVAPTYGDAMAAYVAIASRLKQHKALMGKLGEYQNQRNGLRRLDEAAQQYEREAEEALNAGMEQLAAIPDRGAEKATEDKLCADAADLQTEIDRSRNNAKTLLGQVRTVLASAAAVTCNSPADAQPIRAGWKNGNDLAADLRRILAEVADKTARRRQILPGLNRDRAAKDTEAGRLAAGPLTAAEDALSLSLTRWSDANSAAGVARAAYTSVLARLQSLQTAIGTQPPNATGPDWVFGLFTEQSVRAPSEAFREAVGLEQESVPSQPVVRIAAWMAAHERLGRDIHAQVDKAAVLRNDLSKRSCDATDNDTLDVVRRIVGDADAELEKYQGLPAKAAACETPAPPPAVVPIRLWFDPDTVQVQVGGRVEPRVFAEFSDAPGRAVDVTDRVEWAGGERLPVAVTNRHAGQTLTARVGLGSLAATLTIQVAAAAGAGPTPQAAPTARLECDGSVGVPTNVLEVEAGQVLRKTCRVIVTGWVSDTADRVFSDVRGLPAGRLDVFPPSDFAPGAQMYRAGVNDAWREYRFTHSFSAPANAPIDSVALVIIVRQEDSRSGGDRWQIALPLLVNVIPAGARPGSSLAPPAVVRQGSGGKYGVWRYKLFGDPPPCFHFVAAVMGKYGPPSYEQVGANMTWGEADAEIGRLSRYFDDQYGCAAWPRDNRQPPNPPPAGRKLILLRFANPAMTAQVGVPLTPQVLGAYSDDPGTLIDVTKEVYWSGTRTRMPFIASSSEAGLALQLTATLDDQSDSATINVEEEKTEPPARKLSRFGFAERSFKVKVGDLVAPKVYVVYADDPDRAIDVTRDPRVKFSGDRVVPFTAQASDAGRTFAIAATFEWASDSATVTVEATPPTGGTQGGGRATWVRQPAVTAALGKELTVGESSLSYSYAKGQWGPMSNSLNWSVPPATLEEGQELALEMSVGHFSEWKPTRYGFEAGSIGGWWNLRCFATPGDTSGGGSWGQAISVDSGTAARNSASRKIVFQPKSATGERGDECYMSITAGAPCADACGDYSVVITWQYKRQAPR